MKKQLSPYSTPLLLCTLTAWLFVCPLACFQKPGTCRSLLVQFWTLREKAVGPQAPSAFHRDTTALLSPLATQTPLFQLRLLSYSVPMTHPLWDPWRALAHLWCVISLYKSHAYSPNLFMCPLIILYYSFSWFSWYGSQIHSSDDTLVNRHTCTGIVNNYFSPSNSCLDSPESFSMQNWFLTEFLC